MTLKKCKKKRKRKNLAEKDSVLQRPPRWGWVPQPTPNRGNLEHVSGSHGEVGPLVQLVLLDGTNF